MKIIRDETLCEGWAQCVRAAPELFELRNDTGPVHVLNETPPEELHDKARIAEQLCPRGAIWLED